MWLYLAVALAAPGRAVGEGVVLDAARETVYLAVPGGGIEAVATGTGQTLWTTSAGDFPLASAGDLVVAWKGSTTSTLRIVGLDAARSGGTAVRCAELRIPHGLLGQVDEGLGTSTTVAARVRDFEIEASWLAESHPVMGIRPQDESLIPRSTVWKGSGRCARDGAWTDGPGPAMPTTSDEVPTELRGKAGHGHRRGTRWLIPYIAWDGNAGVFRLQTWDIPSATQVSDVVLVSVRDPNAYGSVSLDGGRIALVTRADGTESQVFDAADGRPVAVLRGVALITWTMMGEAWLWSDGVSINASDATGASMWRRPVRNRRYAGPMVP